MDIEEYIERIVDNDKIEDMQELSDMLEDTMEIIKDYDKECYKDFEMKLYKMAYGNHLNKSMAEDIVNNMRPFGKRWSLEESKKIQEQFGMNDISPIDFFTVLNRNFNDSRNDSRNTAERFTKNPEEEVEFYVCLTRDFIKDEDAKPNKVFKYFVE